MKETWEKEIKTFSIEETVEIGTKLGKLLGGGEIILLSGDLGTGKTAFTSGIAKGLNIAGYITSPTFTIVNEYEAQIPLYHFDVYRINDSEEMYEIGFDEYINSDGVTVIEWAELINECLPVENIQIKITKCIEEGLDVRVLNVIFNGEKHNEVAKLFCKK